jgi:hypothetical protein
MKGKDITFKEILLLAVFYLGALLSLAGFSKCNRGWVDISSWSVMAWAFGLLLLAFLASFLLVLHRFYFQRRYGWGSNAYLAIFVLFHSVLALILIFILGVGR